MPFSTPPFPWQDTIWARLLTQIQAGRLPHALLFSGMQGLGKLTLAKHLAGLLLCEQTSQTGAACKQCQSCHLLDMGTHPDCQVLQPESNAASIKIDQIRAISEFFNHTALRDGYKIAVIYPAEAMNVAAANALLKTLEEPPANKNLLLLLSHQPSLLLETIRSRCQVLHFSPPPHDQAQQWLQEQGVDMQVSTLALTLAEGAPGYALTLINTGQLEIFQQLVSDITTLLCDQGDPVVIASQWSDKDSAVVLSWLLWLIAYMIRHRCSVPQMAGYDLQHKLVMLSGKITLASLFLYFDEIIAARRILHDKINLNVQMLFETLFSRFQAIGTKNMDNSG